MAAGPTPPRPVVELNHHGIVHLPEGWSMVIVSDDQTVLAGWIVAGDFYAYAPTERIVRECLDAIRMAHEHHTTPATDPDVYLSWCDDGITLVCERDTCRTPGPCAAGSCWHQEVLPYRLTPAQAATAVTAHLATHQEPTDG